MGPVFVVSSEEGAHNRDLFVTDEDAWRATKKQARDTRVAERSD